MSPTWKDDGGGALEPLGPLNWLLIVLRGSVLIAVLALGVLLTALLRLIEAPLFKLHRPWTPAITVAVCRIAFWVLNMRHEALGKPMRARGAVVANHASWLDIFTLNARKRIYFVSKSEVAGWAGIGFLAKITGTVFITRDPKQAKLQQQIFEERLLAGNKLLFFPEGTSTDGLRVLPFKSTLFAAFFTPELRDALSVQPVTVVYHAPKGQDARFYGWWGNMDFGPHLLRTLGATRQGKVQVIYHPPLNVRDFPDRKALAKACEAAVRSGMPPDRQGR